MSFIVAIDGTAGSGKGTVSKIVAKNMNLTNIDTGATYRCVTLAIIRNHIKVEDTKEIIKLLDKINIDIKNNIEEQIIFLNGENVTNEIRNNDVTNLVSQVSAIPEVRLKLVELQRKLADNKDVIMDGRDIGTYVFPNADVKIYLDALIEKRAQRRYEENILKGINTSYDEVLENIQLRDKQDKEKKIGALKIADDAVVIDTTEYTIQEVVEKVEKIIKNKYNNKKGEN